MPQCTEAKTVNYSSGDSRPVVFLASRQQKGKQKEEEGGMPTAPM